MTVDASAGRTTTLRFANGRGEVLEVGYDPSGAVGSLWVDRGGTRGLRNPFYTDKMSWAAPAGTKAFDLRLIIDSCSLEIFALGGEGCGTVLQFFQSPPDRVEVTVSDGGPLPALRIDTVGKGSA